MKKCVFLMVSLLMMAGIRETSVQAGTVTSGSISLSCTGYTYNNFTVFFDRNNSGTGYENLSRAARDGAGTLLRGQTISYGVGTSQTWTSSNSYDLASPQFNPITLSLVSPAGGIYTDEQVIYEVSYDCPGLPTYNAPSLSINDVSVAEGTSGTTTAEFIISLSAPAPTGGVTFDIATADGTATAVSGDYVARSLSGQSIAAGASTYTFDVTINSDPTVEGNETFFVNVSNVIRATSADLQGQGTIGDGTTLPPTPIAPARPIITAADHARAQASLCADVDGATNQIVLAQVPANVVPGGNVYCRVIIQNGTVRRAESAAEIGDSSLLSQGIYQAVDVFGITPGGASQPLFNAPVDICLQGSGTLFYLDATTAPRSVMELPTGTSAGYTCASIPHAGTVVLIQDTSAVSPE